MNGKQAKLMRKVGKGLTKKDKKLYNMLNRVERGILSDLYTTLIKNNEEALSAQKKTRHQRGIPKQINETNIAGNRKLRRTRRYL